MTYKFNQLQLKLQMDTRSYFNIKMNNSNKPYGYELILDLHGCDESTFNRESLDGYFEKLCKAIDMVKCERYWWDDEGVEEEERQT